MRKTALLCVALALLFFSSRPFVAAITNLGNALLVHSLYADYPKHLDRHESPVPDSGLIHESLSVLRIAARIAPTAPGVQWAFGRAALAGGALSEAIAYLPIDAPSLAWHAPRYLDTLRAHSSARADNQAILLFENIRPPATSQVISNTVALSYLRRARTEIENELFATALADLEQVKSLRPEDLYANFHLWRQASQSDLPEAENRCRNSLVYFPAKAISLQHEGLSDLTIGVFPALLAEGLWDYARAQNIVAYWVWQWPDSSSVADLLRDLTKRYPQDATWPFYLGELYQRRGDTHLANEYYETALALESSHLSTQQRLRQLQLSNANIEEPAESELARQDTFLVATTLGLPVDTVQLGQNLLMEDTFVRLRQGLERNAPERLMFFVEGDQFVTYSAGVPRGWYWEVVSENQNWQFASGFDFLERAGSIRITNLWWSDEPDSIEGHLRANLIGRWFSPKSKWLMLSVKYRIQGAPGDTGVVFLGDGRGGPERWFTETYLQDTEGQWQRLVVIGQTPHVDEMVLALENRGAANTWFYDVSIRPLDLRAVPQNCTLDPCVNISIDVIH